MRTISLRFGKNLLTTWLNIRIEQKIVYIAFLSIDFPQIATGLVTTRAIKPNTTSPRALSQNKLVSSRNQLIVLSSNTSVVRAAKHDNQNEVIAVLVYLKPTQLFIIISSLIFWGPNGQKNIIRF